LISNSFWIIGADNDSVVIRTIKSRRRPKSRVGGGDVTIEMRSDRCDVAGFEDKGAQELRNAGSHKKLETSSQQNLLQSL
jgi:hypothetical protein